MFMRMDAIRRERLSLGRAVTCRATERGWGYVYVLFCCNPSPSSLRDATRPRAPSLALRAIHLVSPRRGLIVLQSDILKAAFS